MSNIKSLELDFRFYHTALVKPRGELKATKCCLGSLNNRWLNDFNVPHHETNLLVSLQCSSALVLLLDDRDPSFKENIVPEVWDSAAVCPPYHSARCHSLFSVVFRGRELKWRHLVGFFGFFWRVWWKVNWWGQGHSNF